MGMAAAMIPFAGCQKNEMEDPNAANGEGSTFELVADVVQTKTTLDASTYKVAWENDDVLYVVTAGVGTPWTEAQEFKYADGKFSTESTIVGGNYTMNALYAASSQKQYHKNTQTTHKIESVQEQDCTNPTAHIKLNDALAGTFTVSVPQTSTAQVDMHHLYTLMQVNVMNKTGNPVEVTKFEMTAEGANLAGVFKIDSFDPISITYNNAYGSNKITVELTGGTVAADDALPVYFVMAPLANYSGNVTFKVTDSEGNTYSKTVTMSGISFEAGKYNTTPYTISKADEVAAEVYGLVEVDGAFEDNGKYVLAFKDGKSGDYTFINNKGTSNTLVKDALTVANGVITNPDAAYVFTAIANGGGFNLKNSNNKFIYNSGSNTTLNTNYNSASVWFPTFLSASSTYKINGGSVTGRYITYYSEVAKAYANSNFKDQVANGTALDANAGAISVFKLGYAPVVTPKIIVPELEKTALADAESVEIPYETDNINGDIQATVTSDEDGMIDGIPVVEADKVIVNLNTNDSAEEKTATITLSYDGAEDVVVTITQYAAASIEEGLESLYETVTSTNSATPDEFVINVTNAVVTYVNGSAAFIEDETAGMQIYMTSHGLKAGDKLTGTLIGKAYVRYGVCQISDYDFVGSKVSGATIPVSIITISDLLADYKSYVSRRVKIENATVADAVSGITDKNGKVSQGENIINLYNNNSSVSFVADDVVDFVAYPSYYNTDKQLATYESPVSKKVAPPTISCANNVVTIACVTAGATIYYAIGDAEYMEYTDAFEIESDCTVNAYATKTGLIDSSVSTAELVYTNADEPEAPKAWTLVTDASTLKAGDQIVIVAKDYNYAISTEQKSNNRGQAAVTKSGSTIVEPGTTVQKLTLETGKSSGTFAFNTGSGYLYAASSSSNYLRTEKTMSANSSWGITIASNGTATVKASGSNSRNVMQYNQSSSLFACYSSASQKAITIYKYL